ncbi:MAG: HAD family hydrolase [Rubrivivax sp.]
MMIVQRGAEHSTLPPASPQAPRRIAAWSGPRNISTALMRAWSQRPDTAVTDEPLYAHYLQASGLDHPGRDAIVAAGDTDWRRVAAALSNGPVPGARAVWYQKHMAHHLLPAMHAGWVHALHNVLLIRDPALVVASYTRARADVAPDDLGLRQQLALFQRLADQTGRPPLVIDGERFLRAPRAHLRALCADAGLPFTPAMLHWPAGPHPDDGVWAPHWYAAVWRSTGFEPARPRAEPVLDAAARAVAEACRPAYEQLLVQAIDPAA